MYVPHARKLCLRGRFPWLLASPVTAKSRHVVGREGSIFFLSLASQVQERYLSLHFCSQTKKSSGDWTPPLAYAVEAVLKMSCPQHGSSLTRRDSALPANADL